MGTTVTPGNYFIYNFAHVKPNTRHKKDPAIQGRGLGPRLGGWVVFVPRTGFYLGEIIHKMISGMIFISVYKRIAIKPYRVTHIYLASRQRGCLKADGNTVMVLLTKPGTDWVQNRAFSRLRQVLCKQFRN